MKKLNHIHLIGLILLFISTSCSTEKFTLSSNQQNRWKIGNRKLELVKYENLRNDQITAIPSMDSSENVSNEIEILNNQSSENADNMTVDHQRFFVSQEVSCIEKENIPIEQIQIIDEPTDTTLDDCDLIYLKSGEEIKGKVTEINATELKYLKCENQTGPVYVLKKSDVFMVKYRNGSKEVFKTTEEVEDEEDIIIKTDKKTKVQKNEVRQTEVHQLAVASLIIGLVGILLIQIPIGVLALLFGMMGMTKINSKPEKYRGLALAISGLILGIIEVIVFIAYLMK